MSSAPHAVAINNAIGKNVRKYQICLILTGSNSVGTNLAGLRKQNADADVYITRISVILNHVAAGAGAPIGIWRASSVAGGSQVTAADIPKKNTAVSNATLEVRTGAVTGSKANQMLDALGGMTVTTTLMSGPQYLWQAWDISDFIRLTGDEGIIIDQRGTGDADDRYYVTISWEEVD